MSLPGIGGSTSKSARPAYAYRKQQNRLPIYPLFMYRPTVRLGAGLLNRASYTLLIFFLLLLSDKSPAYLGRSSAKASRRTSENLLCPTMTKIFLPAVSPRSRLIIPSARLNPYHSFYVQPHIYPRYQHFGNQFRFMWGFPADI